MNFPRFDANLFRAVNGLAGKHRALDLFGVFCAQYLIVAMFAAVALRMAFAARRPESRAIAALFAAGEVRAITAAGLAFLGNWLFSVVVFRPRPFVSLEGVTRLIDPPITAHSFPSGHSSAAFALGFTMLLVDPPFGLALLVAASFVAFGRVYAGVHYPIDVLAGVGVGLLWALVVEALAGNLHDLAVFRRLFGAPRR